MKYIIEDMYGFPAESELEVDLDEMATAKSTIKKYEALKNKKVWDKQDVLGVAHRLADLARGWKDDMDEELKIILHEILAIFEEGKTIDISPELTRQGIDWLRKTFVDMKGNLRQNAITKSSGMGAHELEVIKNFKKFELVGFKEYNNGQVYAPIYRVIANGNVIDPKDPRGGDSFEYSVSGGWGGASFELHEPERDAA